MRLMKSYQMKIKENNTIGLAKVETLAKVKISTHQPMTFQIFSQTLDHPMALILTQQAGVHPQDFQTFSTLFLEEVFHLLLKKTVALDLLVKTLLTDLKIRKSPK